MRNEVIESQIEIKEVKDRLIEQFNLILKLEQVNESQPIYYIIYYYQGKSKRMVYKSKPQSHLSGNLLYEPVIINCTVLENFNQETKIMIDFIIDKLGDSEVILKGSTTMSLLSEAQNNFSPLNIIKKKSSIQGYAKEGFSQQVLTYLDYLAEGIKYVPIFAIDFSLANLTFDNNRCLHHLNPSKPNIYLKVIESISRMYEGWAEFFIGYGFGAKVVPKKSETSNCFAINGNIFKPFIQNSEGLVKAYKDTLRRVEITLPVNMEGVVKMANQFAYYEMISKSFQKYFLLVIISAGVIDDFDETVYECMRMSSLPISLVMVKVGNLHNKGANDVEELATRCKKSSDQRKFLNIVDIDTINDDVFLQMRDCQSKIPWQSLQFYKQYKGKQRVSNTKPQKEKGLFKAVEEMKDNFANNLEQKQQWTHQEVQNILERGIEENSDWLAHYYRNKDSLAASTLTGSILIDEKKLE
jgi:hypothetical protein